jgi:hypothetical protein
MEADLRTEPHGSGHPSLNDTCRAVSSGVGAGWPALPSPSSSPRTEGCGRANSSGCGPIEWILCGERDHCRDGHRRRWPFVLRSPQDESRPKKRLAPPRGGRSTGRASANLWTTTRRPRLPLLRKAAQSNSMCGAGASGHCVAQALLVNVWRRRFWSMWRRRFWAPAVSQGRIEHLRPHDLWHTAAALEMAAGANPKEVAARAGHTSVSFTLDRYGHLLAGSEQRLNDANRRLG